MPKKTRTPPPPRRVQAPKVRTGSSGRTPADDDRRRKLLLYGYGASGVVALAIVIGLILVLGNRNSSSGGSSGQAIAKTMQAAGFTYRSNPIQPPPNNQVHLASLNDKVSDWSTNPPDGGQHYYTPAPFNFYDEAVPPKIAVHNQEHGGVVIWYGPRVSSATKDKLRSFWQESPNGILATPYAPLGSKIALTAWTGDPNKYQRNGYWGEGHIAVGRSFNEKAFKAFRDAFRAKGPERFPLSAMAPGQ